MTKNTHTHREAWLHDVTRSLDPWFRDAGYPLPVDLRLTCGFPSQRGLSARSRRIGECWSPTASADKTAEIMVSPVLANPIRVAGTLVHELIHAAVGVQHGHKGPFRKLAKKVGFEGAMTATTEGPAFIALIRPILEAVGPYPHAALGAGLSSGPKKQSTRLIKAQCDECGYTVRITRKWLDDVGAPCCPDHGEMIAG